MASRATFKPENEIAAGSEAVKIERIVLEAATISRIEAAA
jgi:hypothetical protein